MCACACAWLLDVMAGICLDRVIASYDYINNYTIIVLIIVEVDIWVCSIECKF